MKAVRVGGLMRAKLLRTILVVAATALAFDQWTTASDFEGNFKVTRRFSSAGIGKAGPVMVTRRTEVEVTGADGTVSGEQFTSDGKPQHASGRRHLTPSELIELRAVLRDAALFEGQCAGFDSLGFDGWFETLEIRDRNGHYVLHAVSGNESFRSGNRERVLELLQQLYASVVTGPPEAQNSSTSPTSMPRGAKPGSR